MKKFSFCLSLIFFSLTTQLFAQAPCEDYRNCNYKHLTKKNYLKYYASHSPTKQDNNIQRLVIVVHGALRNGHEYFNDTVRATKKLGLLQKVMVLAPHFRKVTDPREEGEHFWGRRWYQKWKYGYLSADQDKISSFELIDKLILSLIQNGNFPNLKSIVVTGHSAGGQFTQRYAVGTKLGEEIEQEFIIAPSNPSSYMYLHPERYDFNLANYERNPLPQNCPEEYNEYIYGPINRPKYLDRPLEEIRENFEKQKIIYLMSEEDKGTDSLDRSCEAMAQGKNRIHRAFNFFYYVKKHFRNQSHIFSSIPKIGHDHIKVYESDEAAKHIFGLKSQKSSFYHHKKIGSFSKRSLAGKQQFFMFGGGKNEAEGMRRFLSAANGGNLLVLSGKSDLNHRYTHDFWRMSEELAIPLSSVETISFLKREAGKEELIHKKIREADAIFFTGGNQSKYIDRIKGTIAHKEIIKRKIPIAGTSAGLAIMAEYIFSAKRGGVSSEYVLKNPHTKYVTIEHDFFNSSLLGNLITDTHFSEREREGRLLGFMFQSQFEYEVKSLFGVGIDEQTSLHIHSSGEMVSSGKGRVSFYSSSNSGLTRQSGRLNYGPLKKKILEHSRVYPHFSKLRGAWKELLVKDGEVLYR